MKKILGSKKAVLILGVGSFLGIFYLIASLGGLTLKPAKPFSFVQESPTLSPGGLPSWNGFAYVFIIFIALVILLFFLIPADQRKKYLQALAWLVLTGIIIYLILSQVSLGKPITLEQDTPFGRLFPQVPVLTETPGPAVTLSVFIPPQISSWTSYLVALGLLLVFSSIWGWLLWRKRNKAAPYDALADIARSALDDIDAGKDWGDTILNSYYKMNKSVANWRGIHRQTGATPAEFAEILISAHLPIEAVNHLTVLFERVRYGEKKTSRKDSREAVDCLTAIVEYCQSVK